MSPASRRVVPARLPVPAPGRASSRPAFRSGAAATACLCLLGLLAATPALAFKVAESPEFKGCYVWFNDAGEPLRNKQGREIGRKTPCGEGTHNRDVYEVLFGEAPGTLVIRDSTHQFECVLGLTPGSTTVLVPKACQHWDPQ